MTGYNGYKVGGNAWIVFEMLLDGPKTNKDLKESGVKDTAALLSKAVSKGMVEIVEVRKNYRNQKTRVYGLTDDGRKLLASADKEKDAGRYSLMNHVIFGSIVYRTLAQLCAVFRNADDLSSTKDLIEEEMHEINHALATGVSRGWVERDKTTKPFGYRITPEGEDVLNRSWEKAHGN